MSPERRESIGYEVSFDEVISNAKEIMRRDGNHVPTIIVEGSKKVVLGPIQDMPRTHGERIAKMRFVGQGTQKGGEIGQLQQVFLISEGWLSVGGETNSAHMQPTNDPNRKEVLIISAMQINERKKQIRMFEILRSGDQKVINLEEIVLPGEEDDDVSVELPLVEAFVYGFQMPI